MNLLDDLKWRGIIYQQTDEEGLKVTLEKEKISLYCGVDPTADSMHIGHLLPYLTLRRFQQKGHRPIVLVGGATGMIGDPSGKSSEGNLLDDETLAANVAGMRAQLGPLLDFEDPTTGAIMTNNADWTIGVSYLEFLRDVGKYLTINYMLGKDSVSK